MNSATGEMTSRPARLLASLDQSAFTAKHWRLYAAITLTHLTDGFDLLMIGVVLPGIVATFKISPAEAGLLGSSAFFGMALGAVSITFFADRFGRKQALLLCVSLYGILSLVASFAWSYHSILITRLFQGIGIGAEMPLALSYLMEFVPVQRRGVCSAATISLWQFAGIFAALAAIIIVPSFGWRGMFVLGAIPVLVMVAILLSIPESVRYLVHRNRLDEAERIVNGFSTVDPTTVRVHNPMTHGKIHLGDILHGKYLRCTVGAWIMSVAWSMAFFGMTVWLPSLLVRSGFTLVHSFSYTAAITAAGAAGVFTSGIFMDWLGRRKATTFGFVLGGVSMIVWGLTTSPAAILVFGLLTAFFGTGGVAGCLFTYICEIYPTQFRATGAGFSIAWQRIGGIVAPTVLGILIGTQSSALRSFVVLGGLLLLGGIAAIALTYETRGKALEQITADLAV